MKEISRNNRRKWFYKQGNFFIIYGGYGIYKHTFSLGPDRAYFISAMLLCTIFAITAFKMNMLAEEPPFITYIYKTSIITLWVSLLYTGTCDAGVLTKNEENAIENADTLEKEGYSYCTICQLYRPKSAYHCKECGVCVDGYDHHCTIMG